MIVSIKHNDVWIDLDPNTYKIIDFYVSPPEFQHNFEKLDSSDMYLDCGSTFGQREITVEMFIKSSGLEESILKLNEMKRMFTTKERFYITNSLLNGKAYVVKTKDYSYERVSSKTIKFTLNLLVNDYYSKDIKLTQINTTSSTFDILNVGDVVVDPRMHELKFEIACDFSTELKIKNNSNGDEWVYTGSGTVNDAIKVDGVSSTKNNISIFSKTNHRLICLSKGLNKFTITGASTIKSIKVTYRTLYVD